MEFLYAAARGDTAKLRHMVQYGFDVNTGDYDNRTALMLAVVGGHASAVNTLLGAGADANVQVPAALHAFMTCCPMWCRPGSGPPLSSPVLQSHSLLAQ